MLREYMTCIEALWLITVSLLCVLIFEYLKDNHTDQMFGLFYLDLLFWITLMCETGSRAGGPEQHCVLAWIRLHDTYHDSGVMKAIYGDIPWYSKQGDIVFHICDMCLLLVSADVIMLEWR